MEHPEGLFYSKTHEWAKYQNGEMTVGITDHAQSELSDVVFIELPKIGRVVKQEDPAVVIESVKAAYDIYAPVSGKIVRANAEIEKDPALVNKDPYGKGWLFVLGEVNQEEFKKLMDKNQYEVFLKR